MLTRDDVKQAVLEALREHAAEQKLREDYLATMRAANIHMDCAPDKPQRESNPNERPTGESAESWWRRWVHR